MKQLPIPDYIEVVSALNETAWKMHASEVHGLISGLLSGNPNNHAAWEEMVTGNQESAKAHDVLQLLYEGTAKQLADFLFEFQLLLPDYDEGLQVRAQAMTVWCQGFLTGLKSAGVKIEDTSPGEVKESLDDLVEIAKMNYEEVVESEEDEEAYTELAEYVRLAVIMIYQEFRQEQSGKKSQSTDKLH